MLFDLYRWLRKLVDRRVEGKRRRSEDERRSSTSIDVRQIPEIQRWISSQIAVALRRGEGIYLGSHSGRMKVRERQWPARDGSAEVDGLLLCFSRYSPCGVFCADGTITVEKVGSADADLDCTGWLDISGECAGRVVVEMHLVDGGARGMLKVENGLELYF